MDQAGRMYILARIWAGKTVTRIKDRRQVFRVR